VGRTFGAGEAGGPVTNAEIFEPPEQGSSTEAGWQWRELPAMSVGRFGAGAC
jgi:hypothetical protein